MIFGDESSQLLAWVLSTKLWGHFSYDKDNMNSDRSSSFTEKECNLHLCIASSWIASHQYQEESRKFGAICRMCCLVLQKA